MNERDMPRRTAVRVEVVRVGVNFGCVGRLRYAKSGRLVYAQQMGRRFPVETHAVPHGMEHRARERAEELAALHGFEVV